MVLARSKSRAILSASVGWKSPAAGNLSTTQAVAKQRWTASGDAVIKGQDGTWYLAVRTRKLTRAEEFIVFLSGGKDGKVAAEVTEKDLLDTTGKGRLLYKEIIFGCVGGVFHAADGVRSARVTECIANDRTCRRGLGSAPCMTETGRRTRRSGARRGGEGKAALGRAPGTWRIRRAV